MLYDVDRFFQTVENKAVGIKSLLTETKEHCGSVVINNAVPFENTARSARTVTLIDDSRMNSPLGKERRSC